MRFRIGVYKISAFPKPTSRDRWSFLRTFWKAQHVWKITFFFRLGAILILSYSFQSTFLEPGLWPLLISGTNYKLDSVTTTIQRQSAVFHSIHQLAQSKSVDVAVLEYVEKVAKDRKSSADNVTRAAREFLVQKVSAKTNLSPALLSLVFLGSSNLANSDPVDAKVWLHYFLSKLILISMKLSLIAKYAVRYIVESSSFTDWATRIKWISSNITPSGLLTNPNAPQIELYP